MGRDREPWEWSEVGGVNDNERHLRHSPVSSPTAKLRKNKRRSDDSKRRERTRPGFYFVFGYFIIEVLDVRRFPPPSSRSKKFITMLCTIDDEIYKAFAISHWNVVF